MPAPFNIVAGPASLWVAAVGTAFPDMDNAPSGSWFALGQTDGGVEVDLSQTTVDLMVDQLTGPVKEIRTVEDLIFKFSLANTTAEIVAQVLNDAAITSVVAGSGPATAGYHEIFPYQGPSVAQFALIARGPSPYADNFYTQYQVPVAVQVGKPTLKYTRGEKVLYACEWRAMVDPNAASVAARFGSILFQNS